MMETPAATEISRSAELTDLSLPPPLGPEARTTSASLQVTTDVVVEPSEDSDFSIEVDQHPVSLPRAVPRSMSIHQIPQSPSQLVFACTGREEDRLKRDLNPEQSTPYCSRRFFLLLVSAFGCIFGDLGTSPLYTFSSVFEHNEVATQVQIYGALSVIFWSLTLLVMAKYVILILMADNHGEGGTFALSGLLPHDTARMNATLRNACVLCRCLVPLS
eukprot:TRINITY_DN9069_c0_g1_i2.p1 TRINITY_DN9069_c0_g1~~TRINITY_DN9069_c0_g1_i2.p1  ORF type:complete len:217 (+),score=32.42 TRINITY_DN9069_c0_g1_i2:117-767(+)